MTESEAGARQQFLEMLKANASSAKRYGIVLIIAGILALIAPFAAGSSLVIMVGVLLLVGGVAQLMFAFGAGTFGHGLLIFLLGLLTAVCGGYLIGNSGAALVTFTLFLAAWFIASGIIEILFALKMRPASGWGAVMFSAALSLILGIIIWRQYPVSGIWAIGTLVGAKMLVGGWWLFNIGKTAETTTN